LKILKDVKTRAADPDRVDEAIAEFEELKRRGIRVVSSCPEAVEVAPGEWMCSCHSES